MKADGNGRTKKRIHFTEKEVEPKEYYVLFVDVMGVKSTMTHSLSKSFNFVGKLHVAILETYQLLCKEYKRVGQKREDDNGEKDKDVDDWFKIIPVIDGAYVITEDFRVMTSFINQIYASLANEFMNTEECAKQFILRAGLSYGPIIQGKRLGAANKVLSESNGINDRYRDSLAIGLPIIQAYEAEKKSPPFGVYIDTSVRIKQGKRISGIWYDWIIHTEAVEREKLGEKVLAYFNWAEGQSERLEYPPDRIEEHARKAEQYFSVKKKYESQNQESLNDVDKVNGYKEYKQ